MEHIANGFGHVKENLVGWIIFGLVLLIAQSFIIGIFLLPQAYRAIGKAIDKDAAPELGDLFNFDNIGTDAVVVVISLVAIVVGLMLCVLPGWAAALLLFWAPMIAADHPEMAPMDIIKTSFEASKSRFVAVLIFGLLAGVLQMVATMLCYFPVFVAFPTILAGQLLFFRAEKEGIMAGAPA